MKNIMLMGLLFGLFTNQALAHDIVIDVKQLAGGTLIVQGDKAPSQPYEYQVFKCKSQDGEVPLKGTCRLWSNGFVNVPLQDLMPGYYYVMFSGSLYPELVKIESGRQLVLQLHNTTFRSSNGRSYKHIVFSDFEDKAMRDRVLRFVWGTANVGAIYQACMDTRQSTPQAERFCDAWQYNDYRRLEHSMLWFFEGGYYQKVLGSRSEWTMQYSYRAVTVIEHMVLQYSELRRWVQARVYTDDSVGLFPGTYGIGTTLPNGEERILTGIRVER